MKPWMRQILAQHIARIELDSRVAAFGQLVHVPAARVALGAAGRRADVNRPV